MEPIYHVVINGVTVGTYYNYDNAARHWNSATYLSEGIVVGGIEINEFDSAGNQTRDGWLIHVRQNGVVYVNPNMIPITN